MANDLHAFDARLQRVADALDGPALAGVLSKLGVAAKKDAESAARSDLGGDGRFSGWPKAALAVRYSEHRDGQGITLHRDGRSAGPWRVAEQGRNQGNAGGFAGPGVNRKTGATARTKSGKVRRVRAGGGRRWNGRTRGKQTWSDAEALIRTRTPARAEKAVAEMMRKVIRG